MCRYNVEHMVAWMSNVLTVCWEILAVPNPPLMVFCMRLYIWGAKLLPEDMCMCVFLWVPLFVFLSHILGCKVLTARGFPDWEGGSFLRSEARWTFTRAAAVLSCHTAPSWNIMFVYLRRKFIPLIHCLALLQRLKEFDFLFYLFASFFPPADRVVSRVIQRENFLPPRRRPLWNEIRERKEEERERGHRT